MVAFLEQSAGYPYFLQEWGKHSLDVVDASPINADDARRAFDEVLADLDASFFRVRFDRLTPAEKIYLRGMAGLGPGPHRSGDVAARLGRRVMNVTPTRNAPITEGTLYSQALGDTAFIVPLFDAFMRQMMPA